MTATEQELRDSVLKVLAQIAPEADLTRLRPDRNFRDQLDLDSMDYLNFVIGLHESLHVDIPERDYPKYATLDGCVRSLQGNLTNG